MNLLYNLAINAYATGVRLASHRNRKAALMLAGQANTFNILTEKILNPDGLPRAR